MRNHKVQVKIVDEIPEEKNSFTAYITKNQYESEINRLISELEDKSNISDGSHTFGEL